VLEVNDVSYDRLLDTEFMDVRAAGNVQTVRIWDWEELLARYSELAKGLQANDWLVGDLFGDSWKLVQDWFIEKVHGVDLADYALQMRQAKSGNEKSLELLDGWMDWSVINQQYHKLETAMLRCNGHVFCTAAADKYASGAGDKATDALLSPIGFKPVGQKHLAHRFQTVLLADKTRGVGGGSWTMTTVKDRGRVEMDRVAWNDWATNYMVQVAGWTLQTT
jgi:hypothetical protein